nr:phosphotransferase [Saccharibacillus deserti]
MEAIPGSDTWISAELIDKGWSADRKYRIGATGGASMLLRVSEASLAESKRAEYIRVGQAASLGIPSSRPIDFGICRADSTETNDPGSAPFVYSLLSWIEGEDAQDLLPDLPAEEAYGHGHSAGIWLRRMHGLPAPVRTEPPAVTLRRELERKRAAYEECGYRLPARQRLLSQIEARLPILDRALPSFRQGDYHPGNMIIGPDGQLNIIDFNRSGGGDPYRDFNRLETFTSRISLPFAQGQLDGYRESGPHDPDFWRRISLYCAMECMFAILWAVPFGEPEITDTLERSERIWTDFSGFEQDVPLWADKA